MSFWEWAFWVSVALVLYPYAIYPTLIIVASWIKRIISPRRVQDPAEWPELTIVIPAYREAHSVRPKMESIRRLNYPAEKLRVLWVVATHEGDDTFAPTIEALREYPEVETLIVPHRGKIYSLNEACKKIHTAYTLITDADILLSETSLKQAVVRAVSDPSIGLVGGIRHVISEAHQKLVGSNETVYLGYERQIIMAESEWGYALGVGGGFLLLKSAFWSPMPDGVVDDLYLNLEVILRGGKCIVEPQASGYELPSANARIEFQRKARIAYTAFQTLAKRLSWKDWFKVPLFSFFLLSHKVFRYIIAPLALILLTISAPLALLQTGYLFYGIASLATLLGWIEAYLIWKLPGLKIPRLFSLPGYFLLAHAAQLIGFWKFLRGEDPLKVWQRLPRTELQPSQP